MNWVDRYAMWFHNRDWCVIARERVGDDPVISVQFKPQSSKRAVADALLFAELKDGADAMATAAIEINLSNPTCLRMPDLFPEKPLEGKAA